MGSNAVNWRPAIPLAIFASMWLGVWMILNVERQPLIVVVIPYTLLFWYVAWKHPTIALMLVFSIAPFQQDLSRGGARFSLTEVHIALMLPVVLLHCYFDRRPFRVGPTLLPALLYFAVCCYASLYYWLGRSTILSVMQMAIYLIVVVGIFASYPRHAEQFRPALYGLIAVCCGISLYSLTSGNNFFWGLGKNGVGQSLSCALLVCTELWFACKNPQHKKYLTVALALLAAGLVFSVSRGAWAGCFMGLMLIFYLRRQWQLMIRASIVMIPLIILAWQFIDPTTREYATSFDKKRYNIKQRYIFIDTAKELWHRSPIYGKGVGLRKQYDATNLVWSTLAETGILGLAAFFMMHIVFFAMILRTHKHLARDSIHYSILLIGGALVLRHFTHGMVDHYWSRGAVTMAWGGAGMAVYSYYVVKVEMHRRHLTSKPIFDVRIAAQLHRRYRERLGTSVPQPTAAHALPAPVPD